MSEMYDDMCIRFDTVPALDRQTDGQTKNRIGKTISRAACIVCWRAIKTTLLY